jgi:hypothetical protein
VEHRFLQQKYIKSGTPVLEFGFLHEPSEATNIPRGDLHCDFGGGTGRSIEGADKTKLTNAREEKQTVRGGIYLGVSKIS